MSKCEKYLKQYEHNDTFYKIIMGDTDLKDEFLDWKTTVIFYCALHRIKEHLCKKGVKCSEMDSHSSIAELLKLDNYKLPNRGNQAYSTLYHFSRECRYTGIELNSGFNALMKDNFKKSQEVFKDLLTELSKCRYKN